MGEKLTKNGMKRLKTELDGVVREYTDTLAPLMDFYDEIILGSIDELLIEKDIHGASMITEKQAGILEVLSRCCRASQKVQNGFKTSLLQSQRHFYEDPKGTITRLVDEVGKIKQLRYNLEHLHEDILESYFRRMMKVKAAVSGYVESLPKEDLETFLGHIERQERFVVLQSSHHEMYTDMIYEQFRSGSTPSIQVITQVLNDILLYSRVACAGDDDLSRKSLFIGSNGYTYSDHKENLENMHKCMILGLSAYYTLESIMISRMIIDGELTPFFHNLDSMEAYYPKRDLDMDVLGSLLTPDYSHDTKYSQTFKVVKLKKGNKDERNKIRSKVMVHDEKISLKYIAYGVFGKKIDVVIEYDKDSSKILHLDYSSQRKLSSCNGREFKTYGEEQKIMLQDQAYHPEDLGLNLLGNIEDRLNPMMITDDDGTTRLNLAAIGGEALLETDRYIRENYEGIISAARNSR